MFEWLKSLRRRGVERKLLAWHALGRPVWSSRDAAAFAREGYAKNAIAYRCVRMIAEAAASAPLRVGPVDHPLARLLARPNLEQTGVELLEAFYGHLQVSGNAFLEAASFDDGPPSELYVLRPDRMSVVPGADGWPVAWEHRVGANVRRFARDPIAGDAPILHLKLFHPADARPHPAFPARGDVWADGGAWRLGHWLNGRAGMATLADCVAEICARAGVADAHVGGLSGAVSGYVIDAPFLPRGVLEPLMAAYAFDAAERDGGIVFFHADESAPVDIALGECAAESIDDAFATRGDAAEAPLETRIRFLDSARDYLLASASARRQDAAEGGVETIDAPLVLETEAAEAIAARVLAEGRAGAERARLALGPAQLALEPGDRVALGGVAFEILRVEEAETRRAELRRAAQAGRGALRLAEPGAPPAPAMAATPAFALLDLPPLPGSEEEDRPLCAAFASPWLGAHQIFGGASDDALSLRARVTSPAIMGVLIWDLWPGPTDRWDEGNVLRVRLYGGALASVSADALLNGANAFAIEGADGAWEIVQARHCVLVAPGEYDLSGFLRGQQGTEQAMRAPHPAGARIVKLDTRLARVDIGAHEWGDDLRFAAPPWALGASDPRAARLDVTPIHAALRPWAPAHLHAARRANGDVRITWVRRARLGDHWGAGDPPLGAAAERYRLEILDGGDLVRETETTAPEYVYSEANQIADFGAPPASLQIRAAQLDDAGAPGLKADITMPL